MRIIDANEEETINFPLLTYNLLYMWAGMVFEGPILVRILTAAGPPKLNYEKA